MRGGEKSAPNRQSRDDDDPARRTTFFITNFSDRITDTQLRDAFQYHVNVTDAWVPRQRGANGTVFGFVRCEKIRNPTGLLPSLNQVTINGCKVSVVLVMFESFHRKIDYDNVGAENNQEVRKGRYVAADEVPLKQVNPGRSFADTLYNRSHSSTGARKSLSLDMMGAMYPRHAIGRAVFGVVRDIGCLHGVKKVLFAAGFAEAVVSYIGGLSVLVTFRDRGEAEDFMNNKFTVYSETLVSAQPWLGQELLFDRIVVLRIVG